MPEIEKECVIIVDSVINTGRSVKKIIKRIKAARPEIQVIIAVNVIQREAAALFEGYKIFAVRISGNSFVGKNQARQAGKTGPDTADRLFNLIDG